MGVDLTLSLDGKPQTFRAERLIVVGFAGRNTDAVMEHIHELEAIGVPAPASVPAFFHIDVAWLTQEGTVQIQSDTVSGEVEPVLLFTTNNLSDALVAVGSDLTDRDLERESFEKSKSVPKPVSRQVWRFADVADTWDSLALHSWVTESKEAAYQSGTLTALLQPTTILDKLAPSIRENLAGTVMFLGTIPLNSDFAYVPHFHAQLQRADGSALQCVYEQVKA